MLEQLMATNGYLLRLLCSWMARAMSSLPVPVSPVTVSYTHLKKRTASAIGNTVTLFMLLSLALTALLLALRGNIVSIMSTPEEAVQGTLAYLTVCFIGIPFITAYNIIASIFRGLGDSKSPMYFIAVACVVNIALDYWFMGTLHLGPAGAALGTCLLYTSRCV